MDGKIDGGPAFPGQVQTGVQTVAGIHGYGVSHDVPDRTFPVYSPTPGMTLRDWFAGQALAGILAGRYWEIVRIDNPATASYELADAMIAERAHKEANDGR